MMRCALALFLGFLLTAGHNADALGTYTVVAPRALHPHSSYNVAVTIQGVEKPTTVTLEVSGAQESGGNRSFVETVVVEPHVTKTADLKITDLHPGTYNLTARGTGGLEFINTTELSFAQKSFSVFIQTDKGIYKPGHTVHLRVLLLDRNLKPNVAHPMDVYISDGKQNRVKQWSHVPLKGGVFTANLTLSDSPVLGQWTITASVLNQTNQRHFQVDEYVLPTFEVTATAADTASFKKGKVLVDVEAKYTYGKPVEGEVTVSAKAAYQWPPSNFTVKTTVPIKGKKTVEVDLKDLDFSKNNYDQYLELFVSVEEAFTQRTQNTTTQATVHRYDYNFELLESWPSEKFKPGKPYQASIKATNLDGSPLHDDVNKATIHYGFTYDAKNYTSVQAPVSHNGIIELELPVPENVTMLGIEIEYQDMRKFVGSVYVPPPMMPARDLPSTPLRTTLKTQQPRVNENVEIEVNVTMPLTHLSYLVVGRGDIVTAKSIALASPEQRSAKLTIPVTPEMAPSSTVLIHAIDAKGELMASTVNMQVENLLQNFVNVSVTPGRTEPGKDVELQIQSKPNSFVGLVGVDQSVLLKQSANDITQADVENEVRNYESYYYGGGRGILFRRRRFVRYPYLQPWSETLSAFQGAGAVLLSNGNVNFTYPVYNDIRPMYSTAFAVAGLPAPAPMAPAAAEGAAGTPLGGGLGGGSKRKGVVANPPRVRKNFPETWIWEGLETGADGRATLKRAAPDTITSWVITGFSLDPVYGLGLSPQPSNLTVFRPFFLSMDLPYSVIRGEVVSVPILVFNYMDSDVTAEVTMESNGDFDFTEDLNEVEKPAEKQRSKRVAVSGQSSGSVSFLITPKKLGYITLKASAISDQAGDAVERKLRVKAEGDTLYKNKAFFVDLRNASSFSTDVALQIPNDIVNGSDRIEVSAVGDMLGPSTENLDNLIKMPYGCGEQNMLNFVPNIVVLDYLKNTRRVRDTVASKAKKFMEAGYQRELTYRHEDFSFSAFGNTDPSGSTWLTAFVAKSFRQAEPHIAIEKRIVDEALVWLAKHQAANGSFPEVGKVSHSAMQGGAAKGLALTAYVLITFLYNQPFTTLHQDTVKKALDYVVKNIEGSEDPYAIAIATYALHLAKHPEKEAAFKLLESKANVKDDHKWWNKTLSPGEESNPWYGEPNSLAVEMTSYALLTYLDRGLTTEAIPLMNYLIAQRNSNGGFASTQDTVIGLQALAALAERISTAPGDAKVTFTYPPSGGKTASIDIEKENGMVLHKRELPQDTRKMKISAEGSGCALVQVSYSYNVDKTGEFPLFTLEPKVDKSSNAEHLKLSVCSGFIPGSYGSESNMAVMEVALPSGFTADQELLPNLVGTEGVSRVETKEGDTVIVLYFDKMEKKEYCPALSAYRTHKVALQKPVPVTVYDYYDQSRRARKFYELPVPTTVCDICEDEGCKKKCSAANAGGSSSASPAPSSAA